MPKAPEGNDDGDEDKDSTQDGAASSKIDCVGWLALASRLPSDVAAWLAAMLGGSVGAATGRSRPAPPTARGSQSHREAHAAQLSPTEVDTSHRHGAAR